MGIEISDMDVIIARLDETSQNVTAVKRAAVMEGAKIIQAEIKARAPVDTGFLRDNIVISTEYSYSYSTGKGETVKVGPSEDAFYARFLEFGYTLRARKTSTSTSRGKSVYEKRGTGGKIPAKPFIEPAFLAKRAEAKEAIAGAIREAIDDV